MRHQSSPKATVWDLLRVASYGDVFTLGQLGHFFDLSVEELRLAVDWLCGLGLLARLELFGEPWVWVTMQGHLLLGNDSAEGSLAGDCRCAPAVGGTVTRAALSKRLQECEEEGLELVYVK